MQLLFCIFLKSGNICDGRIGSYFRIKVVLVLCLVVGPVLIDIFIPVLEILLRILGQLGILLLGLFLIYIKERIFFQFVFDTLL